MKRSIAFLIIVVLTLGVIMAGCGGGNNSNQDAAAPDPETNATPEPSTEETEEDEKDSEVSGEATSLVFWTFQELHKQFLDDAVLTWNENNPDRPIELVTEVYSYDEMHNKLLISLQSGVGAPDLADIEISKFANYLKGSTPSLVPLNDYIGSDIEYCVEARFDNYAKDGKYYGIDYHVGATVMYYNTEILDEAGIDPNDIVTWDDFVEAGKEVVTKTGIPMTTVEITDQWTLYPLISQIGSDFFDSDGNIIIDNEDNIRVLQFLYDMVHEHEIAIPTPGGFHHAEEYYAFMNNKGAAALSMPLWYMGRFVEYMPDLEGKIAILPLPVWEEGGFRSAGMGGTGTVVTTQSEHQELAAEFLTYSKVSREGAIKTWTMLGFDPLRWDVWDAPEMSEDNVYTDYFGKEIFDMLLEIKDEIHPTNVPELFPAAVDIIKKDVSFKSIREQSLTPAEALKEAAEEVARQQ
ncbi:MAG: extracellular solute-binding protein [Clostridiales bacterium]|nr:extracellular solute-binding protein [Clostridiales bacterium]